VARNLKEISPRKFNMPLLFWFFAKMYFGVRTPKITILGNEFAGEIESVGKDVKSFKPGDQVFGYLGQNMGAYAEYLCMPEDGVLAIKPANMTYEEAAAIPTGGLNALHYLRKGNIRKGQKVLINGAAGNFGTFAVQLAKYFGAEVTGVDSTSKLDMLRKIGADHVIDYTQEDFTKRDGSYDVIFDVVCRSSFSGILRSLKQNGRYLLTNPSGLLQMVRGLWTSIMSSPAFGGAGKKVIFEFAGEKSEDLIFLKELVEAGRIKSVIDRRYPFDQTAEAHRYVEKGYKTGNVVITLEYDSK
jgi:NADPH:quinone reductase-like Zn-dependent oxidoreductase